MFNNKKANVLNYVFGLIIFNIVWFVALGKYFSDWGQTLIIAHNFTGFLAFCLANINLIIFICEIIGVLGFGYFSQE